MRSASAALLFALLFSAWSLSLAAGFEQHDPEGWQRDETTRCVCLIILGLCLDLALLYGWFQIRIGHWMRRQGCTCHWDGFNPPFRYCRNHKDYFNTGVWPVRDLDA